jgi:hypothetical protein
MRFILIALLAAPAAAQVTLRVVPTAPVLRLPAAPLTRTALTPVLNAWTPLATLSPLPHVQPSPRAVFTPAIEAAGPIASKASPEELAFAAKASAQLAALADDLGEERGMKSSRMTGEDFLGLLEGGRERWAAQNQSTAPSPEAYRTALAVQESVLRMVRAMLKPGEPLNGQVRRALSVWNVFNQAMEEASEKGTLEAIEAEARLFAGQVEQSV